MTGVFMNKLIMLNLLVSLSLPSVVMGNETPGAPVANQTSTPDECRKANGNLKEKLGDNLKLDGTPNFYKCEAITLSRMSQLYSSNAQRNEFNWTEQLNYNCCEKTTEVDRAKCVQEQAKQAARCDAAAFLVTSFGRDFSNPDETSPQNSKGQGAPPAGNDAQAQQNALQSLASSSMTCKSVGIETVDYEGCKKFSDAILIGDSLTNLTNAGQEVIFQGKAVDAQVKHMKEENSAVGALKAQKDGLNLQQDMYQQRATIDGAKLAYFISIYNAIPTLKDVKAKCDNYVPKLIAEKYEATKQTCIDVASSSGRFGFNQNQAMLDQMKSKLINVAASLGSNALLAKLTGDRAKEVNNAIASIDSFKPTDPYKIEETESKSTLCETDSTAEDCKEVGLTSSFDSLSDNVIVFGSNNAGSSFGKNNGEENSSVDNDSSDAKAGAVDKVGAIVKDIDKSGEMEGSSAAKVTSRGNSENGGGGGGGGGGAGVGGGGGSGDAPAAGDSVTAAKQGATPNYGGGTGFSLTGGMGLNSKKAAKKDEENPFGKLFGKEGAKSEQVNFRDLASSKVGNKNDDIFKMISDRYNRVSAEKRLLEYELTK